MKCSFRKASGKMASSAETMALGQGSEHARFPKKGSVAMWRGRRSKDERDVEQPFTDTRDVSARGTFDKIDFDFRMLRAIPRQQLAHEAIGQRPKNADPDRALGAASRVRGGLHRMIDLDQRRTRSVQESTPGFGQAHTGRFALKQRDAELVFEIPHAPADSGLPDAENLRRPAEAKSPTRNSRLLT
jgi:hypothetical protein